MPAGSDACHRCEQGFGDALTRDEFAAEEFPQLCPDIAPAVRQMLSDLGSGRATAKSIRQKTNGVEDECGPSLGLDVRSVA